MASLSCLSIFEAGAFGSDSGNVIVPTGEVQFPITALGAFTADGVATAAFVGLGGILGLLTEAGSSTVSFVGESLSSAPFTSAVAATASFVGTSRAEGSWSSSGVGLAAFAGSTGADEDTLGLLLL